MVNEPDRIEGTLDGQVWAFAEDGGTCLPKADGSVEFALTKDAPCTAAVVKPPSPAFGVARTTQAGP